MSPVDQYLSSVPDNQRVHLEHIRALVRELVPAAEEVITYGMPGFKYKKKYLIAFCPFKNHMSLFPGGVGLLYRERLPDFIIAKGTIQFTGDHLIPDDVLREIIQDCAARIDQKL